MAGDTIITVVGNLTADPELRYTQNGVAVANLTIASTPALLTASLASGKTARPSSCVRASGENLRSTWLHL